MKKILVSLGLAALLVPALTLAQENQPTGNTYCPHLARDLKYGDKDGTTGGQVTELQRFLSDYYDLNPDDYVTGYFGRMTKQNVVRLQTEQSLPAFGYVGPLTRAAIARACSEQAASGTITLTALPVPDAGPFYVRFTSNATDPNRYVIDFGDGATGTMQPYYIPLGASQCQGLGCGYNNIQQAPASTYAEHTYTVAGTYTAKLKKMRAFACDAGPPPPLPGSSTYSYSCDPYDVVATVTVTVTGAPTTRPTPVPPTPVSCVSSDFAPVCGHYPGFCPVGMAGAPCMLPRDRTYVNQCELQNAGATLLHSGTCTGQPLQPLVVLSPHGGETFTAGQSITISWQSPRPDSATTHINLSLGSIPQPAPPCTPVTNGNMTTTCSAVGVSTILIPGTITGTSDTWTIPQSYASRPGQYQITVGWNDTDIDMSAYSGTFTIQ